jgi:hypothetical protein
MESTWQERTLALLLNLAGVLVATAFVAMLLPASWMAAAHERIGMGEFPQAPLVDYLTRSIAALYGFHGVLMMIVARDLRRLRPIAVYLGWMNVFFGVFMTAIDLSAGMPSWWTLVEGPPILGFGLLILWLLGSGVRDYDRP